MRTFNTEGGGGVRTCTPLLKGKNRFKCRHRSEQSSVISVPASHRDPPPHTHTCRGKPPYTKATLGSPTSLSHPITSHPHGSSRHAALVLDAATMALVKEPQTGAPRGPPQQSHDDIIQTALREDTLLGKFQQNIFSQHVALMFALFAFHTAPNSRPPRDEIRAFVSMFNVFRVVLEQTERVYANITTN